MRTKLMVLFTLVGLHACIVFAGQATVTNLAATQQLGIASVDTPSPSGSASKALVTAATTGGMPRLLVNSNCTGAATIVAVPGDTYCIVDVSGGSSASNYPVSYQAMAPPLDDPHKTGKIVLRKIPAGSFAMGSPENELGRKADESQHKVALTKPFYMGIYEITQAQYLNVMGVNPSYFKQGAHAPKRPVESVTWDTVRGGTWPDGMPSNMTFMGKLQSKTGLAFDLPTEAQWEYACRATTTKALNNNTNLEDTYRDSNMDILGRYWCNGPSDPLNRGTAASGSYVANQWGLYDMHGNVWEWCLDWYDTYDGATTNPNGPESGSGRVLRGGSWGEESYCTRCRSASRDYYGANYTTDDYGFRLCLPTGK